MSVPVCLAAGGSVHRNLKNILEWWKNVKGVDMFGNQQIFVTQISLNRVWEWNCILRQAEGFFICRASVAIFFKRCFATEAERDAPGTPAVAHFLNLLSKWEWCRTPELSQLTSVPVQALWSSFVVRSSIVSGNNLLFLLLTIRSDFNDFRNICKTSCIVWELLVSPRVFHRSFLSGVPGACISQNTGGWVGSATTTTTMTKKKKKKAQG